MSGKPYPEFALPSSLFLHRAWWLWWRLRWCDESDFFDHPTTSLWHHWWERGIDAPHPWLDLDYDFLKQVHEPIDNASNSRISVKLRWSSPGSASMAYTAHQLSHETYCLPSLPKKQPSASDRQVPSESGGGGGKEERTVRSQCNWYRLQLAVNLNLSIINLFWLHNAPDPSHAEYFWKNNWMASAHAQNHGDQLDIERIDRDHTSTCSGDSPNCRDGLMSAHFIQHPRSSSTMQNQTHPRNDRKLKRGLL